VLSSTECSDEITWRGPRGTYQALVFSLNDVTVKRIIVRDDPPPWDVLVLALFGSLLFGIVLLKKRNTVG
jgi:hypothetical protein